MTNEELTQAVQALADEFGGTLEVVLNDDYSDYYARLDVVRSGDQGSARKNHAAPLVSEANISDLELLRDGRSEEVQARVQVETSATSHLRPKLSPSERAKFTPPPPDELMGALHEPIHQSTGRSRAARSVRSK